MKDIFLEFRSIGFKQIIKQAKHANKVEDTNILST